MLPHNPIFSPLFLPSLCPLRKKRNNTDDKELSRDLGGRKNKIKNIFSDIYFPGYFDTKNSSLPPPQSGVAIGQLLPRVMGTCHGHLHSRDLLTVFRSKMTKDVELCKRNTLLQEPLAPARPPARPGARAFVVFSGVACTDFVRNLCAIVTPSCSRSEVHQ